MDVYQTTIIQATRTALDLYYVLGNVLRVFCFFFWTFALNLWRLARLGTVDGFWDGSQWCLLPGTYGLASNSIPQSVGQTWWLISNAEHMQRGQGCHLQYQITERLRLPPYPYLFSLAHSGLRNCLIVSCPMEKLTSEELREASNQEPGRNRGCQPNNLWETEPYPQPRKWAREQFLCAVRWLQPQLTPPWQPPEKTKDPVPWPIDTVKS